MSHHSHQQQLQSQPRLLYPGGIEPVGVLDPSILPGDRSWLTHATLGIVVVGASGDLAAKKTYPSLLDLFDDNLLPKHTQIIGYARSSMTNEELRDKLRPRLLADNNDHHHHSASVVDRFLNACTYMSGNDYGDVEAFARVNAALEAFEEEHRHAENNDDTNESNPKLQHNRLFYFAIPPNVFAATALAIKQTCMRSNNRSEEEGFTRLIVEKPFGRDLESFEALNQTLSEHFSEQEHIYRIDHYLGKELVQNLTVMRFANRWLEPIWNKDHIQCVMLTFKEDIGTQGRGGYFDQYGIIRDILQNHLLQVLALMTMEPPSVLQGPDSGQAIRDAKVAVLNAIPPIQLQDVILGQYAGYADDPSITNKKTNTPTFAMIKLAINTPRWQGVPIIMKAGKALNERKAELRIQLKDLPSVSNLFACGYSCPRNEIVLRVQPHEAIYIKTNVKSPGFATKPIQAELEVNYETRFFAHQKESSNPDAYTRLILEVLRGHHAHFVRDDEVRRAWEIFTPLLHQIENDHVPPIVYTPGGRGPAVSDQFIKTQAGYVRNEDYVFYEGTVARKTEGTDCVPAEETAGKGPSIQVPKEQLCDIGLFGLVTLLGQNLALNLAEHGLKVCVGSRSKNKLASTLQRAIDELSSSSSSNNNNNNNLMVGSKNPEDLVARLKTPRILIILIRAGKPTDDMISALSRFMEEGDVILACVDERFPHSIRRATFLQPKGIHYVGLSILGGAIGMRTGPLMMLGGPQEAYDVAEPILRQCCAAASSVNNNGMGMGSSVSRVGPVGSGQYVQMVSGGIEYGNVQLLREVYLVLKNLLGLSHDSIVSILRQAEEVEESSTIESILLGKNITTTHNDNDDNEEDHDHVLNHNDGALKWTIEEGAEKGIAIPTFAAALDAFLLNSNSNSNPFIAEDKGAKKMKDKKAIPSLSEQDQEDPLSIVEEVKAALYCARICLHVQGLSLIHAASEAYQWNLDVSECARWLWLGGLPMELFTEQTQSERRSSLLSKKRTQELNLLLNALADETTTTQSSNDDNNSNDCNGLNLLQNAHVRTKVKDHEPQWRRTVVRCLTAGTTPIPCLTSALSYWDLQQ